MLWQSKALTKIQRRLQCEWNNRCPVMWKQWYSQTAGQIRCNASCTEVLITVRSYAKSGVSIVLNMQVLFSSQVHTMTMPALGVVSDVSWDKTATHQVPWPLVLLLFHRLISECWSRHGYEWRMSDEVMGHPLKTETQQIVRRNDNDLVTSCWLNMLTGAIGTMARPELLLTIASGMHVQNSSG